MAILKIARMGHPVLSRVAAPVKDPTAPEIKRLVADMIETMEDAQGAGLAAPQVHVPLRVVVFQAPGTRSKGGLDETETFDHTAPLTVLINPVIEVVDPAPEGGWEGCLSVPGLRGWVERANHIRYTGYDTDGRRIVIYDKLQLLPRRARNKCSERRDNSPDPEQNRQCWIYE